MEKKVWQKPKLVVLVRGKPEEAVLLTCKTAAGGLGAGPATAVIDCLEQIGVCIPTICSDRPAT